MPNVEREIRTFTREQFYEFVWSAPTTKLAVELGCVDTMIARACRFYDVPKPYSGYWTKLVCGKEAAKTPLPLRSEPELQTIMFHRHSDVDTSTNEIPPELRFDTDILDTLSKARSLGPVKVSRSLKDPHKLVIAAKSRIEHEEAVKGIPWIERTARQRREFGPTIAINVSIGSLDRALRLMDAFIRRLEAIGGGVVLENDSYSRHVTNTVVRIRGEYVTKVRLREKNKQVRISDPDAKYSWDRNRTELIPTGVLLMDDGPSSYHPPLAIDTKTQKIEEKLTDLVVQLIVRAGEERINCRLQEEHEQELRELEMLRREREAKIQRRQQELEKRQAAEGKRVKELIKHAQSWEKSKLVREFLDALCNMHVEQSEAVPIDSELARYLRWGFEQADRLDPLRPSPPSVLDEVVDTSDLEDFSENGPRKPR